MISPSKQRFQRPFKLSSSLRQAPLSCQTEPLLPKSFSLPTQQRFPSDYALSWDTRRTVQQSTRWASAMVFQACDVTELIEFWLPFARDKDGGHPLFCDGISVCFCVRECLARHV
eukprot:m.361042 g.361042  ORF g.361042 m.361042 type:complete len:115 (-) comp19290_c0_seq1:159-503(-)